MNPVGWPRDDLRGSRGAARNLPRSEGQRDAIQTLLLPASAEKEQRCSEGGTEAQRTTDRANAAANVICAAASTGFAAVAATGANSGLREGDDEVDGVALPDVVGVADAVGAELIDGDTAEVSVDVTLGVAEIDFEAGRAGLYVTGRLREGI